MRVFIDTNVLVYAEDANAGKKRDRARSIIADAIGSRSAVLSAQVLQEFFSVVTRKLGADPVKARRQIELFAGQDIILTEASDVIAAIDLHRLHQVAIWDALIIRSAIKAGCRTLLSEDLSHGRKFDGVAIEDPFRDL